ncbi:nucleotidyltransferase family protein [Geminocystis sp. CENA526]|uniref:nucleotidyltransferase family protein n=1 Tax=Geminocystis sp. CENA526 TaxID=1355871 RepID=UPI003D6ECF35
MPIFATEKLDRILLDRHLKLEQERQKLMIKIKQWLEEFSNEYGITKAYIFGSVTKEGRFHENSDIDIAIEDIYPEKYCLAISLLSTYLERDVDLIKLDQCHFSQRIRQTGIVWTKTVS